MAIIEMSSQYVVRDEVKITVDETAPDASLGVRRGTTARFELQKADILKLRTIKVFLRIFA